MEFKFKVLDYQTRAADAVAQVFAGQPKVDTVSYLRDLGTTRVNKRGQSSLNLADGETGVVVDDGTGYRNAPLQISAEDMLTNVQSDQRKNGIPVSGSLSQDLGAVELDVEMETGTGKTYVYTKTMFELNARYGWSKFIIVVPSVAIREGVAKSLEITAKHFYEQYGKRVWSFVYNSSRLNEIDSFASRADISVMIVNMQSFNAFDESKSKEGRGGDKTARIMFSKRDDFATRRPIDVLAKTNPILIIDEPQKMGAKTGATRKAMKQFHPLFSLNYSATHKEKHNKVYALDPLDAYNERLVKRIEVKGIELCGMRGTDGYLYLQQIKVSPSKPPRAVMEFKTKRATGKVAKVVRTLDEGDDLYQASGELEAYKEGYRILSIVPDQDGSAGYVEFMNHERICCGQIASDSTEEDLRRIQIRETIASHLEKEEALFRRGIKCLSLFFIDEVAKYRVYDESGEESLGEYGRIFEEEYAAAVAARCAAPTLDDAYDSRYLHYLRSFDAHDVHKGYFSVDKKGHAIDSKVKRGQEGADDVSAYDLILKNKERLLSFDEPCRFIFSHSALREGWDNPNIFQICTLKGAGDSDISKRQEVGRGLRLAVDQDGVRQDEALLGRENVHRVNLLTVIASESYGSFVGALQTDMRRELRDRPKKVDARLFAGVTIVNAAGLEQTLTKEDADDIMYALVSNKLVDKHGSPTDKFRTEGLASVNADELPENLVDYVEQIAGLVASIEDPSVLAGIISDGRETKVVRNELNKNAEKREFKKLWNLINHKHAYTVEFDSDELIAKSIEAINEQLHVSRLQYRLVRGEQREEATVEDLEERNQFRADKSRMMDVNAPGAVRVRYDLLGEVSAAAAITRKTAAAILSAIHPDKFAMFHMNPEEFIAQTGALIVEAKAAMVVDHIVYNRLDETYDSDIFIEDMPESMSGIVRAQKCIQDWVSCDSDIERDFCHDMDISDEVCVYARLPRVFAIPTPVGNYAPDWAIAFNEGMVKHVYFVAETKGSMKTMSLKGVEDSKIKCVKKLFSQLGAGEVRYDFVDSFEELLKLVKE